MTLKVPVEIQADQEVKLSKWMKIQNGVLTKLVMTTSCRMAPNAKVLRRNSSDFSNMSLSGIGNITGLKCVTYYFLSWYLLDSKLVRAKMTKLLQHGGKILFQLFSTNFHTWVVEMMIETLLSCKKPMQITTISHQVRNTANLLNFI